MRKLNLPLILDTFFAGLCAFLLFFTAIRFYTKQPVIGLIFGICAALLFGALGYLYITKKQRKSLLISRNEKQKKLLSLHLSLSSESYILNLFKKCLKESKICGKRVICGGVNYFFNFKMQPLTEDDIAEVIKKKADGEKTVFCVSFAPQAGLLAENFKVKLVGIDDIYDMLEKEKLLPEKYAFENTAKTSFFTRIKSRFNRKICAPLFWSGLSLLALSYFTYFPVYYIVSGSILLILAAVALVFG